MQTLFDLRFDDSDATQIFARIELFESTSSFALRLTDGTVNGYRRVYLKVGHLRGGFSAAVEFADNWAKEHGFAKPEVTMRTEELRAKDHALADGSYHCLLCPSRTTLKPKPKNWMGF